MTTGPGPRVEAVGAPETLSPWVEGRPTVPAADCVGTGAADSVTVAVTVAVTGEQAPAGPEGADPPAAAFEGESTVTYLVDVHVEYKVVVELTATPSAVLVGMPPGPPGPAGVLAASPPGSVADTVCVEY
jgi:hypothetical protein